MKKRFKLLNQNGRILILRWDIDGKLFGPDWECVASFDNVDSNLERVKKIIGLMNECDNFKEQSNNDRKRTPGNRRGL